MASITPAVSARYDRAAAAHGMSFRAFVVETYGAMQDDARAVAKSIVEAARGDPLEVSGAVPLTVEAVRQRVSVALQRGVFASGVLCVSLFSAIRLLCSLLIKGPFCPNAQ